MATMKSMKLLISVLVVYLIEFCVSKESSKPILITEDNWTDILKGEWMLEFHAPWCPACKNFQSTWEALAKWSDDLDVGIGQTDVTENPGLSGRFFVTALPTIYHVKDGVFRVYSGSRNENDIISFIDEKKYLDLDPVSWLTDPKSLQMSAVGLFFKAAMVIRNIYNIMISDYGIPEWGCYIIFALLTIVFGLLFGLILVCCCDLLFPPKYIQRQQRSQPEEADKVSTNGVNQQLLGRFEYRYSSMLKVSTFKITWGGVDRQPVWPLKNKHVMDESDLLDDTEQDDDQETTGDSTDKNKVRKRQVRRE